MRTIPNRRHVITGIGAAAAAASPFASRAQQKRLPVVALLSSTTPSDAHSTGIRQGLAEAGFVEDQTVTILSRSAQGAYDKLSALAAELVNTKVDVIIAQAPPAARAAKAATTAIPIVFGVGIDPVAEGLVASLARPGGNLTGVSLLNAETSAKRFGLVSELAPEARLIALLINPTIPNPWLGGIEDFARAKGVRLLVVKASTSSEVEAAFATMAREKAEALVLGEDTFLARRPEIANLALRHRLPSIGPVREYPDLGGLASYGTSIKDAYRLIGTMAGRILRGAKPADLAVQQPVKFEMVMNLKTAKALGLTIPPLVLAQADEVIE